MIRLLLATTLICILATQVVATGDPDGFGIWRSSDFTHHEKALNQKIGTDRSARETLGNYGNHMIRMIHRVGDGAPEFHANFVDLWIVTSGGGTLIVGGSLVNAKSLGANGPAGGEMTGTAIDGGSRHEVSAGDVIHIPANTPHQVLVPEGTEITYLRVAIPAK
jgi:mannose-6-phosphate isomerase-like protein (cupin superfamily)